jgi:ABC-type oligopeptide transport system ATPase subunit
VCVNTKERVVKEMIKEFVSDCVSSISLAREQMETFELTCSPGQATRILLDRALETNPGVAVYHIS